MDEYMAKSPEDTQDWTSKMLCDINGDTDAILKMLRSEGGRKMGDHFDMGMLTGMLQNRGIDPGIVALLNEKDGGWGDQGGIWLILLFLFLLGGNGIGGFGNNAAAIAGVDTNAVLNAISTNGTRQEAAISNIANTLGCSFQNVASALASVDKQIAINNGSITNAIQSCCCSIQSSIDKCCCQTNLNIERSTNGLSRELGGAIRDLSGQLANQTVLMNDKFCQLELREKENQIEALRARILEQSQDAQTKILLNAIENQKMVYNGTIDGTLFSGTGTIS